MSLVLIVTLVGMAASAIAWAIRQEGRINLQDQRMTDMNIRFIENAKTVADKLADTNRTVADKLSESNRTVAEKLVEHEKLMNEKLTRVEQKIDLLLVTSVPYDLRQNRRPAGDV